MSAFKAKTRSLLRPAVKIDVTAPIPAPPDRINVWTCQKCGGHTVCIDIHEGTTPFMIGCRAKEGCDGPAYSSFYPSKRPIPEHIGKPQWEWYKPVGEEHRRLSRLMREHVDKGGLDIRRRVAA